MIAAVRSWSPKLIGSQWSPEHVIVRDRAAGIFFECNPEIHESPSELRIQRALLAPEQSESRVARLIATTKGVLTMKHLILVAFAAALLSASPVFAKGHPKGGAKPGSHVTAPHAPKGK